MKTSWRHSGTILIRVGPHHFAFLRGYFEGLPLATLSRRYLETSVTADPDLRVAKSTLKWIREQLMVAARRRGMFADARLILIDPEKLRSTEQRPIPSLEEFREIRDPHELFSEAELIELFHEEYGSNAHSDRRVVRNERLRRRQLNALLELEKLLGSPPVLSDDVAGWLHPVLSKRLKQAGLHTLGQLVDTINGRGYRWWTQVPRFGEKAAAQVVAWLQTESTIRGLEVELGIQATTKASRIPTGMLTRNRPQQAGIVPLEHLCLSPTLDGTQRNNRGIVCTISARNDLEALQQWLTTKQVGSSTWRSYRKEAERFLLWMVFERGSPLSDMSAADCMEYQRFLMELDPECGVQWRFRLPREQWLAPRGTKRWSHLWRPFENGLSPKSGRLSVTILTLLGRWLVETGYWARNPWLHAEVEMASNTARDNRLFSETDWRILWHCLDADEQDAKSERLRFILSLCRETGMRLSELVYAKCEDIQYLPEHLDDGGTLLIRTGARAGHKCRLSGRLLRMLDCYLVHRGQGSLTACAPSTCLIGRLPGDLRDTKINSEREISANGLYQILKEFFAKVAAHIEKEKNSCDQAHADPNAFRCASTEWLRWDRHVS